LQKARKVAAKMAGGDGASVRTWLLTELKHKGGDV